LGLIHVGNEGTRPVLPSGACIPLCPFVLVDDPAIQCIYDGQADFLTEGGPLLDGVDGDVVSLRGDRWFGFAHIERGVSRLRSFSNILLEMQSTTAYCPNWESNSENPSTSVKVEIVGGLSQIETKL
jgi:hypothetical protein